MGFIFGGNTNLTPEQVASRRRIAEALAASSLEPANSLGGGIAQLGKALAARISEGRLNKQEATGRASADAAFSSLFSGGGDQSASMPADTSSDPMAKYRGIIGQIESKGSGDYSALGPDTGKGDRAYGRYQVMGSNIPAWSREATGREMQPNEFLNDPTSQDAVFNKIFGGYMQGNSPDDAASMWFSGKPLDEAGNATDALGTSAGDYVAKFHALDAGGAGAGSMATGGAGPQISVNQTMGALNNPWLSEGQKSVLGALLKQRLDAQQGFSGTLSPGEVAYQGGRQVATGSPKQREIRNDANGVPRYTDTGAAVYPSDQSASGGTQFFSGRSVQAQGLNYLLDQKRLTKEQAANVAAGKTVTGPNGEIIFMTPEGIFTQPQDGGNAAPVAPDSGAGMVPLTGPKLSEDMRKASGFAMRATAADKIIGDPEVAAAGASLGNNLKASVPMVGNYMVPEKYQQFDQAQRDFVNAVLRRESGAAISESEFQNARKQYFPQPGDGPDVLKQKAENRKLAIGSLQASGNPAPTFAPPAGPAQPAQPAGSMLQQDATPEGDSTIFNDPASIPEGATVEDDNGARFVKRGGQLVPVQ